MAFRRALAAATLALALAGCTGTESPPPVGTPTPGPSESTVDPELALARIKLGGSAEQPLQWQLPEAGDPETAAAILVARQFLALNYHRSALEKPNTEAYLYDFVATRRMIDVLFPGGPKPDATNVPNIGPVWLWVLGADHPGTDEHRVNLCLDIGYWHDIDKPDTQYRGGRASLESLTVLRTRENDGPVRWLVDKHWLPDIERLAPTYGQQCTAWATHTP